MEWDMTESGETESKTDVTMESLSNEIGIPIVCVCVLCEAYEKLAGTKFQDKDEPSDVELAAFRTYTINNYKKMREEMGYRILTLEESGVNFFSGHSFNSSIGETVYKQIEAWAVANGAQKQGGCYVATAVYGSYDCPQVWTLRRYRDNRLSSSRRGRLFIRVYYAVSPTLVRWLAGSSWFNAAVRPLLDRFVSGLRRQGYDDVPYYD
jgi:hypothetical protein